MDSGPGSSTTSPVALDKLLKLSGSLFSHLENGIKIPTSQRFYKVGT